MDQLHFISHIVALATAYVLALPIAWDREKHARSAGLRTFPLVALATCGFIQATEQAVAHSPEALARIVEGIIVGMGFIGGGAILKENGAVIGTATAASLWATGAMGLAVGLGSYDVAITICVITFLTLKVLPVFKEEDGEDPKAPASKNSARKQPQD